MAIIYHAIIGDMAKMPRWATRSGATFLGIEDITEALVSSADAWRRFW